MNPAAKRAAVSLALVAALSGPSLAEAASLSSSLPRWNPNFPVFGGGRFVNIFQSDGALTNASAHVAWSLAIPLTARYFWGRKGLWYAGVSWMAFTLLQESLFHAPDKPGPGYPSEVRADLLTRLVPCATLLLVDYLRNGSPWRQRPSISPEGPAMPWPGALDLPEPKRDVEPPSKPPPPSPALVASGILLEPPPSPQSPRDPPGAPCSAGAACPQDAPAAALAVEVAAPAAAPAPAPELAAASAAAPAAGPLSSAEGPRDAGAELASP